MCILTRETPKSNHNEMYEKQQKKLVNKYDIWYI